MSTTFLLCSQLALTVGVVALYVYTDKLKKQIDFLFLRNKEHYERIRKLDTNFDILLNEIDAPDKKPVSSSATPEEIYQELRSGCEAATRKYLDKTNLSWNGVKVTLSIKKAQIWPSSTGEPRKSVEKVDIEVHIET